MNNLRQKDDDAEMLEDNIITQTNGVNFLL